MRDKNVVITSLKKYLVTIWITKSSSQNFTLEKILKDLAKDHTRKFQSKGCLKTKKQPEKKQETSKNNYSGGV